MAPSTEHGEIACVKLALPDRPGSRSRVGQRFTGRLWRLVSVCPARRSLQTDVSHRNGREAGLYHHQRDESGGGSGARWPVGLDGKETCAERNTRHSRVHGNLIRRPVRLFPMRACEMYEAGPRASWKGRPLAHLSGWARDDAVTAGGRHELSHCWQEIRQTRANIWS
ncbi:unnamed protein product [Protopolystoma xenopodis]|uniref:Uncharacterized protein n=1 Tax=Protopolystoma xenopodis TaxID=117903 RepID=A0A448XME4_9PLAT|nr:unnamed protein product [Protopolystoma xenopodis]